MDIIWYGLMLLYTTYIKMEQFNW